VDAAIVIIFILGLVIVMIVSMLTGVYIGKNYYHRQTILTPDPKPKTVSSVVVNGKLRTIEKRKPKPRDDFHAFELERIERG